MSARVVTGVGIAILLGAGIFGAGFWLARRGIPGGIGLATDLRVPMHGEHREHHAGEWGMPFGFGMGGMMGPQGPGARIEPGPLGRIMQRGFPESVEPLTASEARQAVEAFLTAQGEDGLRVGEVIAFDNHAYAVVEKMSDGTGAFEVLVDPGSHSVHLEFGPAMMWNTEFGMGAMARDMGMAGHMPGLTQADPSVPPGVTAEHAAQIAQAYLTGTHAGAQLGEVLSFPGYFTVHFEKDGDFAGMLSVNAYTGQVWEHTWHGKLIESTE